MENLPHSLPCAVSARYLGRASSDRVERTTLDQQRRKEPTSHAAEIKRPNAKEAYTDAVAREIPIV